MKKDIFYIISIILIISYLVYNYLQPDKYREKIKEIITKDSIDTDRINKKILIIDSINMDLYRSDSIIESKIKKNNYKKYSKQYDENKNNIPILPDLGK